MLCNEKKYEFRKRLRTIHKSNIRDYAAVCENGEFEIADGINIVFPENAGAVIETAVKDFQDYLKTSMKLFSTSSNVINDCGNIVISICEDIKQSYIISFEENVCIKAKNERMAAQALYCLEDKMSARHAPFLEKKEICHTFLFSPRMVHSGYQMDYYPDEHLASIAHAGMDAILVFVKGVNMTPAGYMDFNDLIDRASRFGIDVYAYSYIESKKHPDDPDGQDYYDSTYGKVFENSPKFKGVILVGESCGFPSKDPHVSADNYVSDDGIPFTKPRPGYWPCYDYPQFLDCIKNSVRKYNPEADIVFWTYNWGHMDKEARVALINTLPKDITLQATFEMFHSFKQGKTMSTVCDYTLAFEGPGDYFESEAIAAEENGLKLYTMANTAGLTWDMGTIPYEPMPYQWMRRYKAMRECNEKYGLSGVMESHHYGLYPSFISDLAKQCFIKENEDFEENLTFVLKKHFANADVSILKQALKNVSEAIRCYTPTSSDQYGVYRIGPAAPICVIKEINIPSEPFAHFGNSIFCPMYPAEYWSSKPYANGPGVFPILRVLPEIELHKQMREYVRKGIELLKTVENPNDELLYLINLCEFIFHTCTTGINAKKTFYVNSQIKAETNPAVTRKLVAELEQILVEERQNALDTIPLVEKDSRLGWEPSMEYIGDKEHILWKVRHLDYVLDYEIGCYKYASDESWFEK